ncbi:MAG TPA: hypothetical protein VI423_10955 [Paenisporosarcina sp.]|nr:hypothetical protein [Paenisporosarcina sp.]
MKKKMKMNGLFVGVMTVVLSVMLVGCTEEEMTNGDKELSDEYVESAFAELDKVNSLPENVENGIVSEDMYSETMRYVTDFTEYHNNMFEFLDKLNKNPSLIIDEDFISSFSESIDSYEVFIKGFQLSPKTDADYEIDDDLSDTLLYMSYVISDLRQYINTKESYHLSSIEESMNKATTSYTALTNTIKEHKLYIEE